MYRRKEVEQITGIPARRIQFYSENGLLHLAEINTGRGRERLYTKENILELLIIGELSKYKIGLSEIKRILVNAISGHVLSSVLNDSGTYFIYIFDGKNIFFGNGGDSTESAFSIPVAWGSTIADSTSTFFINISKLAKSIKSL